MISRVVLSVSLLSLLGCGDVPIQLPMGLASDGGYSADSGVPPDLFIAIEGLKAGAGNVCWALWDSAGAYEGDNSAPVRGGCVATTEASMTFATDLPASGDGFYGVSVVGDENGNGSLDTGAFGIPKEPFGFSNNPAISFGQPGWSDVRFQPNVGDTITVKLTRF